MQPPSNIIPDQNANAVAVGFDFPSPTALLTAMATAATSLATADPAVEASAYDDNDGECSLLGPFALLVQAALGGLALLSLVYKRWRERPQRPVKIWFFDVSKQVFGSVLLHMANVFMSMLTSGHFSIKIEPVARGMLMARADPYTPNPCSSYLLNLGIDTTLGIPILIFLIRIITWLVSFTPLGKPAESIQSGYYGSPPSAWWWLKQSLIYFVGLFGMKLIVLAIFLTMPWISKVGDWALSWTDGNEKLQIAFVMMIFPLIMNVMQYYIIDSFIKKRDAEHERLPSEDPDEERRGYGDDDDFDIRSSVDDTPSDTESESEQVKVQPVVKGAEDEYDPDVDGHTPAVTGSSSNRSHPGKVVSPELLPKE